MESGTGCLSNLWRGLAFLVAAVLVISMPVALIAYDIGQVVFSKEKVAQIIGDQLAGSDEIRQMLVTNFLASPAPGDVKPGEFNLSKAAERLSPEQKLELSNLLLPEEWFREQFSSIIGGIYDWLDGDQPRPQMMLNLQSLKERLINGGAKQLMVLLVGSWPPCLPGQLSQIEQAISRNRPPPILYCKPGGSFQTAYVERSTAWLISQVRTMPETIPLTGERGTQAGPELTLLRDRIRLAREVLRFGWMIPASLFGLIMALAIRSWLGLTRWWGASLAATGLSSLAMLPFARPLETRLLGQIRPGETFPPILKDILGNAADGIRTAVVQALATQAILLILVGAGLFVGGWLWSRRGPSRVSPGPGPARPRAIDASERPSGLFG